MKKAYCPYCRKEELYDVGENVIEEYKGRKLHVKENIAVCKKCHNTLYVPALEDDNNIRLYNEYRKLEDLITVKEITNFRQKNNISQRELTSILNWGKMTLNRYENGSLPSKSHSDYLKLLISNKDIFFKKLEEAKDQNRITIKTYDKIKMTEPDDDKETSREYISRILMHSPNINNGFKTFDIEKVENLISYIAEKVDNLYLTTLNKYLWFIDCVHFNKTTKSITGISYQKDQYGPVIEQKKYEEISKINAKYTREDIEKRDGSYCVKIKSNNNYDIKLFNEIELDVIDKVIDFLKNKDTNQISKISHLEEGWEKTKDKELISFEYAVDLKCMNMIYNS